MEIKDLRPQIQRLISSLSRSLDSTGLFTEFNVGTISERDPDNILYAATPMYVFSDLYDANVINDPADVCIAIQINGIREIVSDKDVANAVKAAFGKIVENYVIGGRNIVRKNSKQEVKSYG